MLLFFVSYAVAVVFVVVFVAVFVVVVVVADYTMKLIVFEADSIILVVRNMDHHFLYVDIIYVDYTVANATKVFDHNYHIVVDDYMIQVIVVDVN